MPTHHPHTQEDEMDYEEHHIECDYLFSHTWDCNCAELIMRDESKLPKGELIAWAIFIGIILLFILRVIAGMQSIG